MRFIKFPILTFAVESAHNAAMKYEAAVKTEYANIELYAVPIAEKIVMGNNLHKRIITWQKNSFC